MTPIYQFLKLFPCLVLITTISLPLFSTDFPRFPLPVEKDPNIIGVSDAKIKLAQPVNGLPYTKNGTLITAKFYTEKTGCKNTITDLRSTYFVDDSETAHVFIHAFEFHNNLSANLRCPQSSLISKEIKYDIRIKPDFKTLTFHTTWDPSPFRKYSKTDRAAEWPARLKYWKYIRPERFNNRTDSIYYDAQNGDSDKTHVLINLKFLIQSCGELVGHVSHNAVSNDDGKSLGITVSAIKFTGDVSVCAVLPSLINIPIVVPVNKKPEIIHINHIAPASLF